MKNKVGIIIAVLLIIAAVLFFATKKKNLYPGEDKIYAKPPIERTEPTRLAIVEELPEETSMLAMAPSLSNLFTTFQISDDSILGFPIEETAMEMKELFGANIFTEEGLKEIGINADKEIGFYSSGVGFDETADEITLSATLCLPVHKKLTILDSLEKTMKETGGTVTKKEGYTIYSSDTLDQTHVVVTEKGDYCFLTISNRAEKAEEEAKLLQKKKRKKLSSSKRFNKAVKGLGNNGTFFCYLDASSFTESEDLTKVITKLDDDVEDVEALVAILGLYKGAALWFDVNGKDMVIRSIVEIDPKHKMADIMETNTVRSPTFGIGKDPIVLYSQALNIGKVLKYAEEMLSTEEVQETKDMINGIPALFGIDEDISLYELLSGNYSIACYDGRTIGLGSYNTVASIEVNDEKKADILRKALHAKLDSAFKAQEEDILRSAYVSEETVNGVATTKVFFPMVGKLYLGVHKKNIIFASSKDLYEEAINSKWKKGFVKKIKDKNLKYAFDSRTISMFYIDMDEAISVVEKYAGSLAALSAVSEWLTPDDQKDAGKAGRWEKGIRTICKEMRRIEYIVSYSQRDKEIISSEFRIGTSFKGDFISGVGEMIKTIGEELEALE